LGQAQLRRLTNELPKDTRDFIARFEADLDPSITQDQRYEFRITLVPKLGPKGEADTALTFVRESELTPEEKRTLEGLGKSGRVVVREQTWPVASAGLVKPAIAAKKIEEKVPFKIGVHHVVRAWKKLGCRPPHGSAHPERTDEKYCVYDEPHKDYLFTSVFVDKVAREMKTESNFEDFTGLKPVSK